MVMSDCHLKPTSWPPPRSGLAPPCTHHRGEWFSRTSADRAQICKNNELLPGAELIPQATFPPSQYVVATEPENKPSPLAILVEKFELLQQEIKQKCHLGYPLDTLWLFDKKETPVHC